MTASGLLTGGGVLHHLFQVVPVSAVHGEASAVDILARRVRRELGGPASVPAYGDRVTIGARRL